MWKIGKSLWSRQTLNPRNELLSQPCLDTRCNPYQWHTGHMWLPRTHTHIGNFAAVWPAKASPWWGQRRRASLMVSHCELPHLSSVLLRCRATAAAFLFIDNNRLVWKYCMIWAQGWKSIDRQLFMCCINAAYSAATSPWIWRLQMRGESQGSLLNSVLSLDSVLSLAKQSLDFSALRFISSDLVSSPQWAGSVCGQPRLNSINMTC